MNNATIRIKIKYLHKYLLGLLVCILISQVHGEQITTGEPASELISAENKYYSESGNAALTGQALLKERNGSYVQPCVGDFGFDRVTLFPDTRYFKNLVYKFSHGIQTPKLSETEQQFIKRVTHSTTCDKQGNFRFENLPALPYIVYAHIIIIMGTDEGDLLTRVKLQNGQTTHVTLGNADKVQPESALVNETEDCETINTNLDLVITTESMWRDKYAELYNLTLLLSNDQSRIYTELVPEMAKQFQNELIGKGVEMSVNYFEKISLAMLIRVRDTLLDYPTLNDITKAELRKLLGPYLTEGDIFSVGGKALDRLSAVVMLSNGYEIFQDLKELCQMWQANGDLANLDALLYRMDQEEKDRINLLNDLKNQAAQSGCIIRADLDSAWKNAQDRSKPKHQRVPATTGSETSCNFSSFFQD